MAASVEGILLTLPCVLCADKSFEIMCSIVEKDGACSTVVLAPEWRQRWDAHHYTDLQALMRRKSCIKFSVMVSKRKLAIYVTSAVNVCSCMQVRQPKFKAAGLAARVIPEWQRSLKQPWRLLIQCH